MNFPNSDLILIIEDSSMDVELLEILFPWAGVSNPVLSVSTAMQAVAYLTGEPPYSNRSQYPIPSVIFLDLKIPGMNGLEFLEWMRKKPEFRGIFVIVLTGLEDRESIQTAFASGADAFLVKPCNGADLENLIDTCPRLWKRSGHGTSIQRLAT